MSYERDEAMRQQEATEAMIRMRSPVRGRVAMKEGSMTKSQIADKIERQLSSKQEAVHLSAAEWQTIIESLREPLRVVSDSSSREYVVTASASHGPR